LAADRKAKGFSVIQIVAGLYPDMRAFDPRGANEAGFPWEKDYSRIRPEYSDRADQRILYLVEQGIWNDNAATSEVILAESDVISFHIYGPLENLKRRIGQMKRHGRPVICTEWMARPRGSRFDTDLPVFKQEHVGCYQWGLVNGRTQAQFPWWNKPGGQVDPKFGWFHDILHKDGTSYRPDEIETIRRIIAGED